MKILVAGLNHKTAPIDIREKLAFDADKTVRALRRLKNRFHEAEFVLLSTCNRVELYCACKRTGGIESETITDFFSEFQNVAVTDFRQFMYFYEDEDAVRHLLAVASSLDSMVVGEPQIIGQVKDSYRLACSAQSTGKVLNRLFHCAFAAGKKVYTTTSISQGRVSVAGVAVELAKQLFADVSSAKVVVIGAGEMGELIVQHLYKTGCRDITIVNRSYERASDVAKRFSVSAGKWEELQERITGADVVISSAAGKKYLFDRVSFEEMVEKRRKGTLLIIDIAVPRNFEPSINEIEDVYLYSIDDLSEVVSQNLKAREVDIAKGMEIIEENVAEFMDWFGARDIGPLIGQMKEKFARISRSELERFFVGARKDADCKEVLETMVNRVVNKLLHCVIENIDTVAKESGTADAAKLADSIVRRMEEISSSTGRLSAESDSKEDTQS
jgi:glutamyl-tRNA reductase